MHEESQLSRLAAAVLAGTPVDWDVAESTGPEADRAMIRQLRVLAEIGRLARDDVRPERPVGVDRDADQAAGRLESRWGPLQILEEVGAGSSATVYRAWDMRLDREVALKLRPEVWSEASGLSFIEEGRLLARVRNPHVVSIYGADVADGCAGVWMEFVRGRRLDEIVRERGPLGPSEAALVGLDLCRALSAVHGAGVLHRDVKAQNVMREDGGRIVLMDFGIGHETAAALTHDSSGTPVYMAPELFKHEPATVRSDIYSLGVLLYYLVTGSFPVVGRTPDEIGRAHRQGRRTRLRDARPDLPARLVAAIESATAADPSDRVATTGELEAMLLATVAPTSIAPSAAARPGTRGWEAAARHPVVAFLIAAVGVLGIVAAVLLGRDLVPRPASPSPPGQPAPSFAGRASSGEGALPRAGAGVETIRARDGILITGFENRTGNARLDDVAEYAFDRELGDSRLVRIVTPERVVDALRLMKRPASTRLTRAVGLEIAARDAGIRALLTGRLERLAARYLLSVALIDPRDPDRPVMRASLDVGDEAALLPAVRVLSAEVLKALNASPRETDAAQGQVETAVTTESTAAWRLYKQAVQAASLEQWDASLALARNATGADPTFASAHAWTAFVLARLGQRKPALVAADKAMQFADAATEREQMSIRALALRLRGRREQAIGEYEGLLRAYPDDYWAVEQLLPLYDAMQFADRIVRLGARAADLRPNSFRANTDAAWYEMAYSGNVAAAQPYLARARALAPDEPEPQDWLRFEPVFEDWLKGDVAAAAARLDAAAAANESRAEWFLFLGGLDLALGRLRDGERALDRMEGTPDQGLLKNREIKRLQIALARDDRAAVRGMVGKALRPNTARPGPPDPIRVFARFGPLDEVERRVTRAETRGSGAGSSWPAGEIALARGRVDEAVALLKPAWRTMPLGSAPSLDAARSCAEALARRGDLDHAIVEIEDASRDRGRLYQGIGSTIPAWIRARRQLSALYRQAGRHEDAERVAGELRKLLAFADRDFIVE